MGLTEAVPIQADILPLTVPTVIVGDAFTLMVNVCGIPGQPVEFAGVTFMVATIAVVPIFTAVNDGISPVPFGGRPIPGLSFVQVNVVPVPVKFIAVVMSPLVYVGSPGLFTVGSGFIVPATATFWQESADRCEHGYPEPGVLY